MSIINVADSYITLGVIIAIPLQATSSFDAAVAKIKVRDV